MREYLAKKAAAMFRRLLIALDGRLPQDEAQSAAMISYGGTLAAIAGAANVTTKHQAFGIPTRKQCRRAADDAHRDLPGAQHPFGFDAGVSSRARSDQA
jgi:glutamate mutase epsilon subunit